MMPITAISPPRSFDTLGADRECVMTTAPYWQDEYWDNLWTSEPMFLKVAVFGNETPSRAIEFVWDTHEETLSTADSGVDVVIPEPPRLGGLLNNYAAQLAKLAVGSEPADSGEIAAFNEALAMHWPILKG